MYCMRGCNVYVQQYADFLNFKCIKDCIISTKFTLRVANADMTELLYTGPTERIRKTGAKS